MFSKPCQYAIRAMAYLGDQQPDRRIAVREIGEQTGIPRPFLSRIIATLSREGLVVARRGPKGGVALARKPTRITVGDIVEAVEGASDEQGCVLGLDHCSDRTPCPVHESWKGVREEMHRTLHSRSLTELARANVAKHRVSGKDSNRSRR